MKRLSLLAAALAIVATGAHGADLVSRPQTFEVAHAAPAQHSVSGVLGVWGGMGLWSAEEIGTFAFDDVRFGAIGGEGRVNLWLSPRASLQLDFEGEVTTSEFPTLWAPLELGDRRGLFNTGAHLSHRDASSHLIGAFGGLVWSSLPGFDDPGSVSNWFAGVEGQLYAGQTTLYGQAGYSAPLPSVDFSAQFWFARSVGRFFLTPNDKLQAEVGYARGNYVGQIACCGMLESWNLGALYEHRFDNPLSVFVEYAGQYTRGTYFKVFEHQAMVGLRLNFHQDTLQAADRGGTTLDLPKIGRPLAWAFY